MLKLFNPRQLAERIHEAPERCGVTIREAARRMGEPNANYLSRQINPDDSGAKLGVEDFVYFLAATDLLPLDDIEAAFGRVAFRVPDPAGSADGFLAANAARATREFGEWLEKVGRYMAPESQGGAELSREEALDLIKEGNDVIRAFAVGMTYLKARFHQP